MKIFYKSKKTVANKTIWILWYQGYDNAPEIVKLCIKSWIKFNPDYQIVILDKESLKQYISLPDSVSPENKKDISIAHYSDLCRIALLKDLGGCWADATAFCCKSLNAWLPDYYSAGFFTFRNPAPERMMANWFMAGEPDNIILTKLYTELLSLYESNIFENQNTDFGRQLVQALSPLLNKNYKSTLLWHSDIIVKGLKVYPYFIFHYTFNKLILENPNCRKVWEKVKIFDAKPALSLNFLEKSIEENKLHKAIQEIKKHQCPMYKLSWKIDANREYWDAIVENLLTEFGL